MTDGGRLFAQLDEIRAARRRGDRATIERILERPEWLAPDPLTRGMRRGIEIILSEMTEADTPAETIFRKML